MDKYGSFPMFDENRIIIGYIRWKITMCDS
jgi:hypothetical protein